MNGVYVPGSQGSTQGKGAKEAFWNILREAQIPLTLHLHPPNTQLAPETGAPPILRNFSLDFPTSSKSQLSYGLPRVTRTCRSHGSSWCRGPSLPAHPLTP